MTRKWVMMRRLVRMCRLFAGLLLSAFVLGSCLDQLELHWCLHG